jgi:predicted RNA methylase
MKDLLSDIIEGEGCCVYVRVRQKQNSKASSADAVSVGCVWCGVAGTGTGFLSLLAARAGAAHVYACDTNQVQTAQI